jgi:dipeptidyl aminopeptidase/acylaminoacyl peptidase
MSRSIIAVAGTCLLALFASAYADEPASKTNSYCTPEEEKEIRADLEKGGYRLVISLHMRGTSGGRPLFLVNAWDGTVVKPLTKGPDYQPRVSPDGTKIAFTRKGQGLMVLHRGTDKEEKLKGAAGGSVAWSPDSAGIAFTWGKKHKEKRGIGIYDFRTKKVGALGEKYRGLSSIDWSPDGKWFAADVRGWKEFGYCLAFMSADGEKISGIQGARGCHPCFSRDGKRMCWNIGNGQGLGLLSFDPTAPGGAGKLPDSDLSYPTALSGVKGKHRHLAHGKHLVGDDPSGRWSPDDKYIVFVRRGSEGYGVVRVSDGKVILTQPKGSRYGFNQWDYDWMPLEKRDGK